MPRYTSSQSYTEGNTQIVALPDVEEKKTEEVTGELEDEPYEVKLARISASVPLRVQTVMGSSAGSGSGDFHMYKNMRRHEQDRLTRMDADYRKRMEEKLFAQRRAEHLREDEEKTAKKRAKRQKKKDKKRAKGKKGDKSEPGAGHYLSQGGANGQEESSEEEADAPQEALD